MTIKEYKWLKGDFGIGENSLTKKEKSLLRREIAKKIEKEGYSVNKDNIKIAKKCDTFGYVNITLYGSIIGQFTPERTETWRENDLSFAKTLREENALSIKSAKKVASLLLDDKHMGSLSEDDGLRL